MFDNITGKITFEAVAPDSNKFINELKKSCISSDNINSYGVNIFEVDNYYVVEDIENKFTVFDEKLNVIVDLPWSLTSISWSIACFSL